METKLSNNALKRKYKNPTIKEDPLQFHAKPFELSHNAAEMPVEHIKAVDTEEIFTRAPFSTFALDPKLIKQIENPLSENGLAIKTSTSVQKVVIPMMLEKRRNVLLKSQTGSGKTLTYLVPIVNDLMRLGSSNVTRSGGCRALIIAPTRELCGQIADVLAKLTQCCVWMVSGSISGGEKKKSEKARLRKGVIILVATPGRLLDHIQTTESFNLTNLRWVVLDEADRLLDMGFEQVVLQILSLLRGESLPGLKDTHKTSIEGETKKKGVQNMQTKWSSQNAKLSKKCLNPSDLTFLMASATVTKAVKALALPIMFSAGFVVVDADAQTIDEIKTTADLVKVNRAGSHAVAKKEIQPNSTISFDNNDNTNTNAESEDVHKDVHGEGEDETDENVTKKARLGSGLERNEHMNAPSQLSQYFMMVTCKWRLAGLLSFLKTHSHQKVVVFFSTCDSVDYHALLLREMKWPQDLDAGFEKSTSNNDKDDDDNTGSGNQFSPTSLSPNASQTLEPLESTFYGVWGKECLMYRLHGNVPQKVRQTVYRDFCNAKSGILLCTDVAARGLDLPAVDWILQYDPPCETTDYVHRIGRTARRGLVGSALLFLLPSEANYITLLTSHGLNPEALSLQSLIIEGSKHIPGAAKFKNSDEMGAVILQRRAETVVYNNKWLLSAGRQAFRSFVRAYATHSSDTKGIFKVQSLHLGHVAKTFGLRESPKNMTSKEDVIGKIFNGVYSEKNVVVTEQLTSKEKQKARDDKYKLSKTVKGKSTNKNSNNSSNSTSSTSTSNGTTTTSTRMERELKKGKDRQKLRKMSTSKTATGPSGKFRKTDGYFRKKLRAQVTSEFSS